MYDSDINCFGKQRDRFIAMKHYYSTRSERSLRAVPIRAGPGSPYSEEAKSDSPPARTARTCPDLPGGITPGAGRAGCRALVNMHAG